MGAGVNGMPITNAGKLSLLTEYHTIVCDTFDIFAREILQNKKR
jgi:hypothetical protein